MLERVINQLRAVVGSNSGSVVSFATFCFAYSLEAERHHPQFDLILPWRPLFAAVLSRALVPSPAIRPPLAGGVFLLPASQIPRPLAPYSGEPVRFRRRPERAHAQTHGAELPCQEERGSVRGSFSTLSPFRRASERSTSSSCTVAFPLSAAPSRRYLRRLSRHPWPYRRSVYGGFRFRPQNDRRSPLGTILASNALRMLLGNKAQRRFRCDRGNHARFGQCRNNALCRALGCSNDTGKLTARQVPPENACAQGIRSINRSMKST